MAHAFQPIPGKSAYGNIKSTEYASDYTKNKIARVSYCRDKKNRNCKKRYSQCELLTYKKGFALSRYGFCTGVSPLNYSDLTAGLYTQSNLQNVAVISDVSYGIVPTTIDPCVCPFYSYYTIDPKGELFGNTACGLNNFTSYMTLKSNTLPPPPTNLSVTLDPIIPSSSIFTPALALAEGETCSVIFSWQPPINDGGSLISEYVVNYYPQDDESSSSLINISNPSTDVSINIPISSTYVFQVAAVNLTGQGPFAQIEYTSPTYPDAPTDATATFTYIDTFYRYKLTLLWTAPTFAGGGGTTISYYEISFNFGGIQYSEIAYNSPFTLADFDYNTTYTFQVYSVNSLGLTSQTSADVTATTTPSGPPTNLLCSERYILPQETYYLFSWTPPATGTPIISYTFNYQKLDLSSVPHITSNITIDVYGESYNYTIDPYSYIIRGIQVAAVNSVGQGPYAPFLIGAPTALIATPGILSVSLSWTTPTTGGMPVTYYIIEDSLDGLSWSQIDTSSITSYNATDLLNTLLYYFRVAAVNAAAVDHGPYSVVVSSAPLVFSF